MPELWQPFYTAFRMMSRSWWLWIAMGCTCMDGMRLWIDQKTLVNIHLSMSYHRNVNVNFTIQTFHEFSGLHNLHPDIGTHPFTVSSGSSCRRIQHFYAHSGVAICSQSLQFSFLCCTRYPSLLNRPRHYGMRRLPNTSTWPSGYWTPDLLILNLFVSIFVVQTISHLSLRCLLAQDLHLSKPKGRFNSSFVLKGLEVTWDNHLRHDLNCCGTPFNYDSILNLCLGLEPGLPACKGSMSNVWSPRSHAAPCTWFPNCYNKV